jgi:hypothetical protein
MESLRVEDGNHKILRLRFYGFMLVRKYFPCRNIGSSYSGYKYM